MKAERSIIPPNSTNETDIMDIVNTTGMVRDLQYKDGMNVLGEHILNNTTKRTFVRDRFFFIMHASHTYDIECYKHL